MNNQNIESIIINWLNDLVPGYPASSDTPKALPKRFILVERTGGGREALVGDAAEILVEVYDKQSRFDCSEIANFIADHVRQLVVDYENITRVGVNSIITLDDTQKQYYRYQIYLDVFHRRMISDTPPTPTPIPSV